MRSSEHEKSGHHLFGDPVLFDVRGIGGTAAAALSWNTFLGPAAFRDDIGHAYASSGGSVVSDQQGNIYVAGISNGTWGNPINPLSPVIPYSAFYNVYVAKLNADGVVQWNTFLGIYEDAFLTLTWTYLHITNMTADLGGNIYVVCTSGNDEVYAAKINGNGMRRWLVSLGSSSADAGQAIAVDSAGNVYVGGSSNRDIVHAFNYGTDAFVAKLNASGVLQWNTFWGGSWGAASTSPGTDYCMGLAVDANGDVYATGKSDDAWGSPIRPYSQWKYDAFVAKIQTARGISCGTRFSAPPTMIWDARSSSSADGYAYVAGESQPYLGLSGDALHRGIGCLPREGGSLRKPCLERVLRLAGGEIATSLTLDSNRNAYIAGLGSASWGSPDRPYTGDFDAFAVKLDSNGNRSWNTFLGGSGRDYGTGIGLDKIGNVYVSGASFASWGSPILPFPGVNLRAFTAKIDVTNNQAVISTSKSEMAFGAVAGGEKSPDQTFQIVNAGAGILDWDLSSNRSWLSCTPTSGYEAGLITVSVDPTGLPTRARRTRARSGLRPRRPLILPRR